MTNFKLENLQNAIKEEFKSNIALSVIEDMFDHGDEYKTYLENVTSHGCISGMVGGLIYYNQTEKFHDDNEGEIDEIIAEYLEMTGESFGELTMTFNFDGYDISQLKNWKSWFAYECVASNIYNSIENGEYDHLKLTDEESEFLKQMNWLSGYDGEDKNERECALDIFRKVQFVEEDDMPKLEGSVGYTMDVNLYSIIATLLENEYVISDIETMFNFYYNEETACYYSTYNL